MADIRDTAHTAIEALAGWWKAMSIKAVCVGLIWWIGLLLMHVPLAGVWGLLGGLLTFVPNIGGVITVVFPVFAVLFTGHDLYRLGLVLGLYAIIVVVDQIVLQPLLLKKVSRVPIWASIVVPIVAGFVIPFWGILIAPPLLAVFYAFRKPRAQP